MVAAAVRVRLRGDARKQDEYLGRKMTGLDLCFITCLETEWRLDWREKSGNRR